MDNLIKDIVGKVSENIQVTCQKYFEDDKLKSPSVMVWLPDIDEDIDTYGVISANIVVREPTGNNGTLARSVYLQLQDVMRIETEGYIVFGVTAEQGVRKLRYTQDNVSTEHLIMIKIFYSIVDT